MSKAAQAAASDPTTSIASPTSLPSEAIRPARRFSKAPDFWLLSPLLYAPLLPLSTDLHPLMLPLLHLFPSFPPTPSGRTNADAA
ncbi:unnamed protein product [Closterium sp. Naga37s-1]|nr:unnamed protein product [Closterium sp. Naga37s-1]